MGLKCTGLDRSCDQRANHKANADERVDDAAGSHYHAKEDAVAGILVTLISQVQILYEQFPRDIKISFSVLAFIASLLRLYAPSSAHGDFILCMSHARLVLFHHPIYHKGTLQGKDCHTSEHHKVK